MKMENETKEAYRKYADVWQAYFQISYDRRTTKSKWPYVSFIEYIEFSKYYYKPN